MGWTILAAAFLASTALAQLSCPYLDGSSVCAKEADASEERCLVLIDSPNSCDNYCFANGASAEAAFDDLGTTACGPENIAHLEHSTTEIYNSQYCQCFKATPAPTVMPSMSPTTVPTLMPTPSPVEGVYQHTTEGSVTATLSSYDVCLSGEGSGTNHANVQLENLVLWECKITTGALVMLYCDGAAPSNAVLRVWEYPLAYPDCDTNEDCVITTECDEEPVYEWRSDQCYDPTDAATGLDRFVSLVHSTTFNADTLCDVPDFPTPEPTPAPIPTPFPTLPPTLSPTGVALNGDAGECAWLGVYTEHDYSCVREKVDLDCEVYLEVESGMSCADWCGYNNALFVGAWEDLGVYDCENPHDSTIAARGPAIEDGIAAYEHQFCRCRQPTLAPTPAPVQTEFTDSPTPSPTWINPAGRSWTVGSSAACSDDPQDQVISFHNLEKNTCVAGAEFLGAHDPSIAAIVACDGTTAVLRVWFSSATCEGETDITWRNGECVDYTGHNDQGYEFLSVLSTTHDDICNPTSTPTTPPTQAPSHPPTLSPSPQPSPSPTSAPTYQLYCPWALADRADFHCVNAVVDDELDQADICEVLLYGQGPTKCREWCEDHSAIFVSAWDDLYDFDQEEGQCTGAKNYVEHSGDELYEHQFCRCQRPAVPTPFPTVSPTDEVIVEGAPVTFVLEKYSADTCDVAEFVSTHDLANLQAWECTETTNGVIGSAAATYAMIYCEIGSIPVLQIWASGDARDTTCSLEPTHIFRGDETCVDAAWESMYYEINFGDICDGTLAHPTNPPTSSPSRTPTVAPTDMPTPSPSNPPTTSPTASCVWLESNAGHTCVVEQDWMNEHIYGTQCTVLLQTTTTCEDWCMANNAEFVNAWDDLGAFDCEGTHNFDFVEHAGDVEYDHQFCRCRSLTGTPTAVPTYVDQTWAVEVSHREAAVGQELEDCDDMTITDTIKYVDIMRQHCVESGNGYVILYCDPLHPEAVPVLQFWATSATCENEADWSLRLDMCYEADATNGIFYSMDAIIDYNGNDGSDVCTRPTPTPTTPPTPTPTGSPSVPPTLTPTESPIASCEMLPAADYFCVVDATGEDEWRYPLECEVYLTPENPMSCKTWCEDNDTVFVAAYDDLGLDADGHEDDICHKVNAHQEHDGTVEYMTQYCRCKQPDLPAGYEFVLEQLTPISETTQESDCSEGWEQDDFEFYYITEPAAAVFENHQASACINDAVATHGDNVRIFCDDTVPVLQIFAPSVDGEGNPLCENEPTLQVRSDVCRSFDDTAFVLHFTGANPCDTAMPTSLPSKEPTASPSECPTNDPTMPPTMTDAPTVSPTRAFMHIKSIDNEKRTYLDYPVHESDANNDVDTGVLVFFDGGAEGYFCANGFTMHEAELACQAMGYLTGSFEIGDQRVTDGIADEYSYSCDENSICEINSTSCPMHNSVVITCHRTTPNPTVMPSPFPTSQPTHAFFGFHTVATLTRTSGVKVDSGLLTFNDADSTGYICGSEFGQAEADNVCAMMGNGYTRGEFSHGDQYSANGFKDAYQHICTDNGCKTRKMTTPCIMHTVMLTCVRSDWSTPAPVELTWKPTSLPTTQWLMKSPQMDFLVYASGREWVKYICAEGFGQAEANVACEMLGSPHGGSYRHGLADSHDGYHWAYSFKVRGDEVLTGPTTCSSGRPVYVDCFASRQVTPPPTERLSVVEDADRKWGTSGSELIVKQYYTKDCSGAPFNVYKKSFRGGCVYDVQNDVSYTVACGGHKQLEITTFKGEGCDYSAFMLRDSVAYMQRSVYEQDQCVLLPDTMAGPFNALYGAGAKNGTVDGTGYTSNLISVGTKCDDFGSALREQLQSWMIVGVLFVVLFVLMLCGLTCCYFMLTRRAAVHQQRSDVEQQPLKSASVALAPEA